MGFARRRKNRDMLLEATTPTDEEQPRSCNENNDKERMIQKAQYQERALGTIVTGATLITGLLFVLRWFLLL